MMKSIFSTKNALGIIFGIVIAAFSAMPVSAVDEKVFSSVGISPATSEFSLLPGNTYQGSFQIVNPAKSLTSLDYKISIAPYSVINDRYDADFETETDSSQITKWITLSKQSGSLAPGESEDITYTINTPEDAIGGGQYAAFLIDTINTESDVPAGSVAISANPRVASLIFASVDGETHTDGLILENNISAFLFDRPIMASSLVENTGNTHAIAKYALQVYPLFSDEEIYSTIEHPKESYIMPNTKLYAETKWEESPMLGIYKVRQTITIDDEVSTNETHILVCPMWFLVLVTGFIVFCGVCIVYRIHARRKNIKHAISDMSKFRIN